MFLHDIHNYVSVMPMRRYVLIINYFQYAYIIKYLALYNSHEIK